MFKPKNKTEKQKFSQFIDFDEVGTKLKPNQLPFISQCFNDKGKQMQYNVKKIAVDLIAMGFKDERVERVLKFTQERRIEYLIDFLVPSSSGQFTIHWNHEFMYMNCNKTKKLQEELCPMCKIHNNPKENKSMIRY